MFDILEIVFSEGTVRIPVAEQDMRPVDSVGVLEEEKGLRTCQSMRLAGPTRVTRLTFQQTERHPATHGLLGPLNLTARCKSAKLVLCWSVSSHRVL